MSWISSYYKITKGQSQETFDVDINVDTREYDLYYILVMKECIHPCRRPQVQDGKL